MKRGDLVRFTTHLYQEFGLGLIMGEKKITDRYGQDHHGFFWVFTAQGPKVVAGNFMEVVERMKGEQ